MNPGLDMYLALAALLFAIGLFGVFLRRNTLVIFMCLELMLNAANLALLAFARFYATPDRPLMDGPVFILIILAVAAAEVAVGLAIIVQLYRLRQTVMVPELDLLKD